MCMCLCVILTVRWEPSADLTVWFHRVSGGPGRFWGPVLTAEAVWNADMQGRGPRGPPAPAPVTAGLVTLCEIYVWNSREGLGCTIPPKCRDINPPQKRTTDSQHARASQHKYQHFLHKSVQTIENTTAFLYPIHLFIHSVLKYCKLCKNGIIISLHLN